MRNFVFMADLTAEDREWLQGLADALREKESTFFEKLDTATAALTKGMITQGEALEWQERFFLEKQVFTDARNVIEHYVMWMDAPALREQMPAPQEGALTAAIETAKGARDETATK